MRISTLVALAALVSTLPSCDGGGAGAVGAPCNTAEDCDGDLICDEHNGQASCQKAHPHGETDASASGSGETGHSHDTETGHDTEAAESGTSDAGTSGTQGSSTDATSTETGDTDATGTTGGSALCDAFCGCMESTCVSYGAYPYADSAACMTACEAFDEATLGCFGSFCQQAMDSEGTLVEHYCEHAWGELGDEKC